jgi:myo-inositol-1(or 4)-monophosphatase
MEPEISDSRLDIALSAALAGGDLAAEYKQTAETELKQNETVVTTADKQAESLLRDRLTAKSSYPILGEEQEGTVSHTDTYWVVDPIDGTRNFSKKQPLYATAVALVEDNEPRVGVAYIPELDYVFYAVDGKGAYRNTTELSVSSATEVQTAFYILSGKGRTEIHPHISEINDQNQQLGSAVMAEAWVASGWCDIAVFGALAPWDMAVGVVLIREAGGKMKTIVGNQSDWDSISEGRVLFGNPALVENVSEYFGSEMDTVINQTSYEY